MCSAAHILTGRAVGVGVDRRVGQELAYVKAAGVGDKISARSAPPISSYPYEIRHGVPCWPDWIWPSLEAWRRIRFEEDGLARHDEHGNDGADRGDRGAACGAYGIPKRVGEEPCGTAGDR